MDGDRDRSGQAFVTGVAGRHEWPRMRKGRGQEMAVASAAIGEGRFGDAESRPDSSAGSSAGRCPHQPSASPVLAPLSRMGGAKLKVAVDDTPAMRR